MSQSPLSDMNYITSLSGWCLVLGCLFLFTFVICPSGELGMVITLLYIFTGLSRFFLLNTILPIVYGSEYTCDII